MAETRTEHAPNCAKSKPYGKTCTCGAEVGQPHKRVSGQGRKNQRMNNYESSVERLIVAVRIAAKATVNPELAKTLNEAADWMEVSHG